MPLKNHEHRIRGSALAQVGVARLVAEFLRLADEPGDLIFRQIRERRDEKEFRIFDHLYFAQILMDELHRY